MLTGIVAHLPSAERIEVRVLTERAWARHFYQKHGFREIGSEALDFGEDFARDVIIMTVDRHALSRG